MQFRHVLSKSLWSDTKRHCEDFLTTCQCLDRLNQSESLLAKGSSKSFATKVSTSKSIQHCTFAMSLAKACKAKPKIYGRGKPRQVMTCQGLFRVKVRDLLPMLSRAFAIRIPIGSRKSQRTVQAFATVLIDKETDGSIRLMKRSWKYGNSMCCFLFGLLMSCRCI